MLRDPESGRKPGRANAAYGDAAFPLMRLDAVILELGRGAEPGIDRADLVILQRRQDLLSPRDQIGERFRHQLGALAILLILGGRPDQEIAESRPADHDALGRLGRYRQQDMSRERSGRLVIDHELAFSRADLEITFSEQDFVHKVAMIAGGVHDESGPDGAATGLEPPIAIMAGSG